MKNAETPALKVILLGASGSLGCALVAELLRRQHEVTAIVDDPTRPTPRPGLHYKQGGLQSADQAEQSVAGGSAVIFLPGALAPDEPALQLFMTRQLLEGLARTTIRRLLLAGDSSLLETGEVGELMQGSDLQWTLVNAPPAVAGISIEHFRRLDQPLEPGLAEPLERLARTAAGMIDCLELKLHFGERINFTC